MSGGTSVALLRTEGLHLDCAIAQSGRGAYYFAEHSKLSPNVSPEQQLRIAPILEMAIQTASPRACFAVV